MPYPLTASSIIFNSQERIWQKVYRSLSIIYELFRLVLLVTMIAIVVDFYLFSFFRVEGISMMPSFSDGQYVIVNKFLINYERGDIIAIRFPADPIGKKLMKRIVGLPTERVIIKDGVIFINGQKLEEPYLTAATITQPDSEWLLRDDEFFVLGDNRGNSNDSRYWGPVPTNKIIGKITGF